MSQTPSSGGPPARPHRSVRALPRGIWALGLVSMFMDASSELVHSLLPMLMATVLGASMVTIGLIEGTAEATASITKVFSGTISDYFRKRKLLALIGYGLAAATKPVFPLANTIGWVFGARFVDRVGKGIRGAPRDALVADITPPQLRGAAYGLRQALDSLGAFLGPLLAVALMLLLANDLRAVLWVAVLPAILAVLFMAVGVSEPEPQDDPKAAGRRLALADAARLPVRYWLIVGLGAVFTLARFSEAFLVLRAHDLGVGMGMVPAVMVVMNLVYAGCAYPAGAAADRHPARWLLFLGLVILVVADVVWALADRPWVAFAGAGLWGLHLACTQGLLTKLVADTAPAELRGTAFGVTNLVSGAALLMASAIAGWLWSTAGPAATFAAGAAFAAVAAAGLLVVRPRAGRVVAAG